MQNLPEHQHNPGICDSIITILLANIQDPCIATTKGFMEVWICYWVWDGFMTIHVSYHLKKECGLQQRGEEPIKSL